MVYAGSLTTVVCRGSGVMFVYFVRARASLSNIGVFGSRMLVECDWEVVGDQSLYTLILTYVNADAIW